MNFTLVNFPLVPSGTPAPQFERVAELRAYLAERGWSPEQLAAQVGVSNMTWRRMLARPDSTRILDKYRAVLERHCAAPALGAGLDPVRVVVSGLGGSERAVLKTIASGGAAAPAEPEVLAQVERKRARARAIPGRLLESVSGLLALLPTATRTARLLILGGLLYFVNPFDLVADAVLGIGFVDDIGIALLIHKRLGLRKRKK